MERQQNNMRYNSPIAVSGVAAQFPATAARATERNNNESLCPE
jgi:hypothetical protein